MMGGIKTLQVAPETAVPVQAPTAAGPEEPRAALHALICDATVRIVREQFGDDLSSVILTGSLARDEATFEEQRECWAVLGDAEFMLIFKEGARLPNDAGVARTCRLIEQALANNTVQCAIGLGAVHPGYLRTLTPHIFAYELRMCGRVCWGDDALLSLIPPCASADLPREDAWRLLCNRMIEQLDVVDELVTRPARLSRRASYRTVKLYLDMATSYLVFAGAYEPTYRGRAARLKTLARSVDESHDLPFPLREFAERVGRCTEMKLNGTAGASDAGMMFWEEAAGYARLLWRWELAQLTRTRVQLTNRVLMKRWMDEQPFSVRARGWLYVVRKLAWYRSLSQWPRWARFGWDASPRYRIYRAVGELYLRLSCLLKPAARRPQINVDWEALRATLPVMTPHKADAPSWQRLAADILWNYHQFLEGTRS